MRAVALDGATVDLDEDDASIDGPRGEKGRNERHLHEGNGSQAVEALPGKAGCHDTWVGLLLFGRLLRCVT